MRAVALILLWAIVVAGCAQAPSNAADPPGSSPDHAPTAGGNETWFLKPGFVLSTDGPNSSQPQAVPLPPGQNAYANEDLDIFHSEPVAGSRVIEAARIEVFFEVTEPVGDPFVTSGQARIFIFWLGSDGALAAVAQTYGDPLFVPGQIYQVAVDFPMPKGGIVLGHGRMLDLLAIMTASNQEGTLRLLVDHDSTPSRIELVVRQAPAWPAPASWTEFFNETVTIPGNSGAFSGATQSEDSQYRMPVTLDNQTSRLRIELRFLETQGPKADLDMWLYDPMGNEAATSTTPFQSETIDLWPSNLEAIDHTTLELLVEAYSGVDTRFTLRVLSG